MISMLKEEEDQIVSFALAGKDAAVTVVTAGLVCSWDCLVLEQHSGYRRHRGDSQGVELDQPILHSQLQNLQPSLILPHKLLLYGRFSTDSLFC